MTDFEIFTNFVLSYFNCYICPGIDKLAPGKVGAQGTHINEKPGKPKLLLQAYGRWPARTHFCKGIKDGKQMPRIHVRDVKERSSAAAYLD